MPKELDSIEYDLSTAISNGIKKSSIEKYENQVPIYPHAYIKENNALVIECKKKKSEFQDFAKIFPLLCKEHKIDPLPDEDNYCVQKDIIINSQTIYQFTFNVDPDALDSLLMLESIAYRGYRNSQGPGSIMLLANPLLTAHKKAVICAFPVIVMEDNSVMLRIAGCNASELISTQLSYFITHYLPAEIYNHSTKHYGHWGSEIVQCLLANNEELINAAIRCFSSTKTHLYQQNIEGFDKLPLHEESLGWLKNIDETNEMVYHLLGVVSSTELKQLKSLEIPVEIYLKELIATLQGKLKEYEPGGSRAVGGSSYYEDHQEYYKSDIATFQKNIENISLLLSNLSQNKHFKKSSFTFFQNNEEEKQANLLSSLKI